MKFDDENKVARVSLRATELLAILNQKEANDPQGLVPRIAFNQRHLKKLISFILNCRCKIIMASRIWSLYD